MEAREGAQSSDNSLSSSLLVYCEWLGEKQNKKHKLFCNTRGGYRLESLNNILSKCRYRYFMNTPQPAICVSCMILEHQVWDTDLHDTSSQLRRKLFHLDRVMKSQSTCVTKLETLQSSLAYYTQRPPFVRCDQTGEEDATAAFRRQVNLIPIRFFLRSHI